MNEAKKLPLNYDFSETAFIEALVMGKIPPSEAIIAVSTENLPDALKISKTYSCRVVCVPIDFMGVGQWLVIGPETSVWSPEA